MVVAAFMFMSQPAIADDLADLKATHMSYLKAINAGDVETFMGFWVEGGVVFFGSRAFPIVVNIARDKQTWSRILQTHRLIIREYKPDYRVIGNTGLVWGHFAEVMMNKQKGIGKRRFRKFSYTYVKSEGKWKIALFHATPIPGDQDIF
jgi:ketosteroid isomerase-like protein